MVTVERQRGIVGAHFEELALLPEHFRPPMVEKKSTKPLAPALRVRAEQKQLTFAQQRTCDGKGDELFAVFDAEHYIAGYGEAAAELGSGPVLSVARVETPRAEFGDAIDIAQREVDQPQPGSPASGARA